MIKRVSVPIDVIIDKLTNSIESNLTKDSFQTEVSLTSKTDFKEILKKNGWMFDWKMEWKHPDREVYKLTIVNDTIIQGLICLETKTDHIYMHLIENAVFNKGRNKLYVGVPGNLVAFACRLSFQRGFDGNVSFLSKS